MSLKKKGKKLSSASVPLDLYLEAIKLNKENNTSLMATLVNYFPGISGVFLWDFSVFSQGLLHSPYFLNGISGLSLSAFFIIKLY